MRSLVGEIVCLVCLKEAPPRYEIQHWENNKVFVQNHNKLLAIKAVVIGLLDAVAHTLISNEGKL